MLEPDRWILGVYLSSSYQQGALPLDRDEIRSLLSWVAVPKPGAERWPRKTPFLLLPHLLLVSIFSRDLRHLNREAPEGA